MIYKQLINHKLFKFIQIGNRTALVVRSADAVELGAFGRVQGALAHGTVVDVGTFAYFCKYNISFRIYRNVDYDSSLFLDRVSWAWETSRSERPFRLNEPYPPTPSLAPWSEFPNGLP